MTNILHLTPHLGGGVGKALSSLSIQAMVSGSAIHHTFVCLESPEKAVFVDRIRTAGCRVHVAPDVGELEALVAQADIVHLNWWNHPAMFAVLCQASLPAMRLFVWSHVSGLSIPYIPTQLLDVAHRFVFTSACSLQAPGVSDAPPTRAERFDVVSSGCGLEYLPEPTFQQRLNLRSGYLGSLNFGKLHPNYVDFLAAVNLPGFQVDMVGDNLNQTKLEAKCAVLGRPSLLNFRGFRSDVTGELSRLDVLIYLLNPEHYGTAENALIEAMAMGVVPVVLDNPAETSIVEDGVTGLVVRTPADLAGAMDRLATDSVWRLSMAKHAARTVRARYTTANMEASLSCIYQEMLLQHKQKFDFSNVFGKRPAHWFLSCQGHKSPFGMSDTLGDDLLVSADIQFEDKKGSVFHFLNYFPDDTDLKAWVAMANRWLASREQN